MTSEQAFWKRIFDVVASFIGLVALWWLILLAFVLSSIDTGKNGFFTQTRIGRDGRHFKVIKIRSMREIRGISTSVTTGNDPRITRLGAIFRKTKIDELPQLVNVLLGQMSLVGPRPDVPGYYDELPEEEKRILLSVRPGITGPATLKYRNEEEVLATAANPEKYNKGIIFPDKVRINREYIQEYSYKDDMRYILATVLRRQM